MTNLTTARRVSRWRISLAALLIGNAPILSAAEPSIRVILVGDSTMQQKTGYGDALCQLFTDDVVCINLAKGGRSSGSFRAEGMWDTVIELLRNPKAYRKTYVLIQFGHNDQPGKPGRSTDLSTEFPVNMTRYVEETTANGGSVVLVTPLSRRSFREGALRNDLKPWAEAVRKIAQLQQVPLLDLNTDSAAAISAIGPDEANTFAMEPPPARLATVGTSKDNAKVEPQGAEPSKFDYTHLGPKGASYFAHMVAREISQVVPGLAAYMKADMRAQ